MNIRTSTELRRADVTRASGWSTSVSGDDCACGRHLAADEPQPPEGAVLTEEALSATNGERVDHQLELVDQVALDQALDERGAADCVEVLSLLRFQGLHGLADIAPEQHRVLPVERLDQGGRGDVLRHRVQ